MNDKYARQAIVNDLSDNFWVEASAGSGKTQSLASRIVQGLVTGIYAPAGLAAVTFTRKAAAELRVRVRLNLEQQGATAILACFDRLFIGTVHSFCAQILRMFPVQAKISPGFREVAEVEEQRLRRECLSRSWETSEGRALAQWLALFEAEPCDISPALDWMVEHGDLPYPTAHVSPPDVPSAWAEVNRFRDFLLPMLPPTQEPKPTCKILAAGIGLRQSRCSGDLKELLYILGSWQSELKLVKRYWGCKRAEQDLALAQVVPRIMEFQQQVVRPFLCQSRSYLYLQLVPFLTKVRQACILARKSRGWVNQHDLLYGVVKLLRNHPGVRESLQSRFQHLLVDEFQDTDPLQAEIFWLLAGPGPAWHEVKPRPGSLFLVGDPKQSIYRFRQADIQMVQEVREQMKRSGGRAVELNTSFRSGPSLCRWLNETFSQLFPIQPCLEQARFSPLVSSQSNASEPAVFPLHAENVQDEAQKIAASIYHRVTRLKTHQFSDFLVLTARKAEVQLFRRALEDWSIPCEAAQELGLLGQRAASLLPLLRHLADPQDKAILVGVLRGPLFGHSDEELFLHVRAAGTLRPYPAGPGLAAVCASLQKLDRWRLAVRWLPAGAAVNWLMRQTGLWSLALAEGASSVAQLRGLADCMRRSSEAGLTLAQAVAEVVEKGALELPAGRCGQRNAVRILNLHKAKGMQGKVVFLAAPEVGFSSAVDHLVGTDRAGYFCLRKWRRPLAHPSHWAELEQQEHALLQGEQLRFLYVAATRARETLVVSVACKATTRGPWRALEPFLQGCPEWCVGDLCPPDLCDRAVPSPRAAPDCHSQPSWQRGTMALRGSFCKPTLPAAELGVDASDWGRLVHRLLEYRVRRPNSGREQWMLVGRWFCFENPELLRALPAALNIVEQVTQSLLWDWVKDASQRLVEIPIGVKHGRKCLFGTIDLALKRADGWGLVDYKTDRQRLEALVAQYALQLEHYAHTWTQVLVEPLRYTGIFAVREGRLSLDLSPPGAR